MQQNLSHHTQCSGGQRKLRILGKDVLDELRGKFPDKVDIYQGDATRYVAAQLRKATANLNKARSDSFKDRQ
eukprot:5880832-Ditylum_brightwellii.AAC.1